MKVLVLSGLLILASTPAGAARPPVLSPQLILPVVSLTRCLNAIKRYRYQAEGLRDIAATALAMQPHNGGAYLGKPYQVASPDNLPALLEEANLAEEAATLRLTLRQYRALRNAQCEAV